MAATAYEVIDDKDRLVSYSATEDEAKAALHTIKLSIILGEKKLSRAEFAARVKDNRRYRLVKLNSRTVKDDSSDSTAVTAPGGAPAEVKSEIKSEIKTRYSVLDEKDTVVVYGADREKVQAELEELRARDELEKLELPATVFNEKMAAIRHFTIRKCQNEPVKDDA